MITQMGRQVKSLAGGSTLGSLLQRLHTSLSHVLHLLQMGDKEEVLGEATLPGIMLRDYVQI